MASRYLLIEFDDADGAEKLKERINEASRAGKAYRVVGLFAKPTNYCQCDPNTKITTKVSPSVLKRGKKFGWWVCTQCKRPDSSISGLRNLLNPHDIIKSPQWALRSEQWSHYIPTLSGLVLGANGRKFWNERS